MSNKKYEALRLALEALEHEAEIGNDDAYRRERDAIREALADSALDRMAENARNLGLDYAPIVERVENSVGMGHGAWDMVEPKELAKGFHEAFAEPPCKTGSQCTSKCSQCEQPAQERHISYVCPQCYWSLDEQPAQQAPIRVPVTDNTYGYAKNLAEAIFKQHFASDEHYASGRIVWGVNDTVIGILTQIDNMVADMVRRPAQQPEPYGQVTVVRRPGCVDQHWFYRWPEPPYLDNAAECHTVYTSPPASKPWVGLTNQELLDLTTIYSGAQLYCAIEAKLREKNDHCFKGGA